MTGFTASSNQFVLGGAVNLSRNPGAVQYVKIKSASGANNSKTIIILGLNENNARFAMPTFYQVTANAAGDVPFVVQGACTGNGQISGIVTLYFN